jgi:hypothetical protein
MNLSTPKNYNPLRGRLRGFSRIFTHLGSPSVMRSFDRLDRSFASPAFTGFAFFYATCYVRLGNLSAIRSGERLGRGFASPAFAGYAIICAAC